MIKVLVVDDHAFVRAGVTAILNGAGDIEVSGECSDGEQVSALAASVGPDVVLMDMMMPLMSGIEATRELTISRPTIRTLIFTGYLTAGTMIQASEVGAAGVLLKGGDPNTLVGAVRTVAAGGTVWPKPGCAVS